MTISSDNIVDECCPTFSPKKWDNKSFSWEDKPFIQESVPAFLHIPSKKMLGKKITKMMQLSEEAHQLAEDKTDILLLFMDPHAFRSNIYLSVMDTVPNANNTTLSGTFMTKVFDGPFKAVPKFIQEMESHLKEQQKQVKNYYVHYAYCPKCAKEKGHNYMVVFAEVEG